MFGYEFTVWTAQRLIAHLEQETGIQLSVSRLRTVMRQQGYVYRRPKHELKSLQDPQARATAEVHRNGLTRRRSSNGITPDCY